MEASLTREPFITKGASIWPRRHPFGRLFGPGYEAVLVSFFVSLHYKALVVVRCGYVLTLCSSSCLHISINMNGVHLLVHIDVFIHVHKGNGPDGPFVTVPGGSQKGRLPGQGRHP